MHPAVVLDPDEARQLTDQIKVAVEGSWLLIVRAYQTGAHLALGYKSWDDYTTREFGTSRLRLPREERQEVVASLRDAGLSVRAIETVTGVSRPTVISDLKLVKSLPPAKPLERATVTPNFKAGTVKGTDGKTYPSKPAPAKKAAPAARRKPLTDALVAAGLELRRSSERLNRLSEDDRFEANKKEAAARLRSHLSYTVQVCQDVLDRIAPTKEQTSDGS